MSAERHLERAEEHLRMSEDFTLGSPYNVGHVLKAIAHATLSAAQPAKGRAPRERTRSGVRTTTPDGAEVGER